MHANSTHTNTTYLCHKPTALVKEVTSNFLGGDTYDCMSNVLTLNSKDNILLPWLTLARSTSCMTR